MKIMKNSLKRRGIDSFSAGHDVKFGSSLSETIQGSIMESDALVAIITKNNPSLSVAQEVGFALNAGMSVIPFVESGAHVGFMLGDIAQKRFTRDDIQKSCDKIVKFIDEDLELEDEDDEEDDEEGELADESKVISDYEIYGYDFEEGEILKGRISSNFPINVYVMDNRNLKLMEDGREFSFEEGNEQVLRYSFNFIIPKSKTWNVIIENDGSKPANVDVKLSFE